MNKLPNFFKRILVILAVLGIVIALAVGVEIFGFNFNQIGDRKTRLNFDNQNLYGHSRGFIQGVDSIVSSQQGASISLEFDRSFVNKFAIEYSSPLSGPIDITYRLCDAKGSTSNFNVSDTFDARMGQAITNVDAFISGITVVVPAGMMIHEIRLTSLFAFNWLRFLFIFGCLLITAILFFCKRLIEERIHIVFLGIGLIVGLLLLIAIPPATPMVWDDDVHFVKIYRQSFRYNVPWSQAAWDFEYRNVPKVNTLEEKHDALAMLDKEKSVILLTDSKTLFIPYNELVYLPQSMMLMVARHMDLAFTDQLLLSRAGNLLLYLLIITMAIRKIPNGKKIMAAVALAPTPLFLASTFSYDPPVIAFSFLAFSYFMHQMSDETEKIELWDTMVFVGSIAIASLNKAIYSPLLLLAMLFPARKFGGSVRRQNIYRLLVIGVFLVILASFVLPTILTPNMAGDPRGGDTSISGQMRYILQAPLNYLLLLFTSIWKNLGFNLFGTNTFSSFAYLGVIPGNSIFFTMGLLLFATLTDVEKNPSDNLKSVQKVYLVAILIAILCLIWTALYLSFTPVGLGQINGVQSRYYLPIMVPFLFLIRQNSTKAGPSSLANARIILGGSAFITLSAIYTMLLVPYNF